MSQISRERSRAKNEYVVILHDIRSVINVGALFRTADAVGVSKIILSGFSPTPIDRFGRVRADFAKSALGSEQTVAWEYVKTPMAAIKKLKREGFVVVGIEQDKRSVDYKKIQKQPKMAFILGTETTGVSPSLLKQCDIVAEIPMRGMKESLNVAVAAGIVLYRILDK